jgi:hypothetical protein
MITGTRTNIAMGPKFGNHMIAVGAQFAPGCASLYLGQITAGTYIVLLHQLPASEANQTGNQGMFTAFGGCVLIPYVCTWYMLLVRLGATNEGRAVREGTRDAAACESSNRRVDYVAHSVT